MFNYIRGILAAKSDSGVVIDVGGVGFEIYTPDNSSLYLAKVGDEVTAFTVMTVREDDISLYGFGDKDSLNMFKKLTTVSGVGAKAGLAVLSAMPLSDIKQAIVFEDVVSLTRANGIGKKIAQRIVLELKDKLGAIEVQEGTVSILEALNTDDKAEAVNALIALGYSKGEAINSLAGITDDGLSTEEYIKKALKKLF